jgi:hypothetical protein
MEEREVSSLEDQIEFITAKKDYAYEMNGDGLVGDMYASILESLHRLKDLEK